MTSKGDIEVIKSFLFSILFQYEARARLERLSGSTSISSADLFEDQRKQSAGTNQTVRNWSMWGMQALTLLLITVISNDHSHHRMLIAPTGMAGVVLV